MQQAGRQGQRPKFLLVLCIRAWLAKRKAGSLIIALSAPMSPNGFMIHMAS